MMLPDLAVEGLLFDLDGVVVDSELARDKIMQSFIATFGKVYDRDRTKPKLAGKPDIEVAAIIKEDYRLPGTPRALADARNDVLRDLYANRVPFVPGFPELYATLRAAYPHARVAAASGMDSPYYDLIDRRLRLTDLFDGKVFLSHRLKTRSKPAPDIFLRAMAAIDARAEACVVFEDAPNGVVAGLRAGARVVCLTRTFDEATHRRGIQNLYAAPIDGRVRFVDDFDSSRILEYLRS